MTLRVDISAGLDLDPSMRSVSGLRALADAIVRRLTTTAGALRDYPGYGFNLIDLIGSSKTKAEIKNGVEVQVNLEEEVEEARVVVSFSGVQSISIHVAISIVTSDGPFDLTISVDDLGVDVIFPPGL